MGDIPYFDSLIACYLSNELSPEDEKWFLDLVNSSEEHKQRFEEMRKVFNLSRIEGSLDQIDVDAEWTMLRNRVGLEEREILVELEEEPARAGFMRIGWKRVVIYSLAACLTGVLAFKWWSAENAKDAAVDKALASREVRNKKTDYEYQINNSTETKAYKLPDGSEVVLFAHSWIRYAKDMKEGGRSISLNGKASFQVVKDAQRPFTVSSGEVATTALGTRFIVTAYDGTSAISVRLEEGKVVIRSSGEGKGKLKKDYFLVPGDEFIFNRSSSLCNVVKYSTGEKRAKKKQEDDFVPVSHEEISIPIADRNSNWFMFNNQSLPSIFETLEEIYQVEITYSRKELSNLYFIGSFRTTDPVQEVLQKIADLNDLRVIADGKKYQIRKIR